MNNLQISYSGPFVCFLVLLAVTAASTSSYAGPVDMGSEDYGTLSGLVYSDDNNTAKHDNNEFGIRDVLIILDGLIESVDPDGPVAYYWGLGQRPLEPGEKETFQMFTWSDQNGRYRFHHIPPGTYSLTEITPYMFVEGKANEPGNLGGKAVTSNQYAEIVIAAGKEGINYNFGEWGLRTKYLSKRDLIVVVPEPSIAVFVIGLIFLGVFLRRQR